MENKEIGKILANFEDKVSAVKSESEAKPYLNISYEPNKNPISNKIILILMILVFGGFALAIIYFLIFPAII